jgi:hypothetical protein
MIINSYGSYKDSSSMIQSSVLGSGLTAIGRNSSVENTSQALLNNSGAQPTQASSPPNGSPKPIFDAKKAIKKKKAPTVVKA